MANIYSKTKIFHFKEKLDSLPLSNEKILPPIHIRLKPTNYCNHNCYFCAYRAKNLQLGAEMNTRDFIPKEKINEILDDLIEIGVKAVTFSGGGEPFVYPYFLEVIKKLSKSPIKFSSLTNGSMLKGDIAELFARHGTWIRISIDGWDDASYSEYRGVPKGEFSKVIKNIENFQKLNGKCLLGVSIITDKKNAPHIYELNKRLKEAGVKTVKISPCIISDNVKENNDYHLPLFSVVKEQITLAKKLEDENFKVYDLYHAQLESFKKTYEWCPYLQILLVIGADLNIYSCQDKAYNLKEGLIGSIKNQRFRDFWFSDKSKFFKINPSLHCNHHCVADEKNKMILDYLDTDEEHGVFV